MGPTEASLAGLAALGVAVPGYRVRPVTVLKIWCYLAGLALLTLEIGMNATGLAFLGIPAAIVTLIPWLRE